MKLIHKLNLYYFNELKKLKNPYYVIILILIVCFNLNDLTIKKLSFLICIMNFY